MTHTNSTSAPNASFGMGKRMLAGAVIGLILISLFVLPPGNANPAWGKFWMVRPLIIVPLAGAMGGLCNYYIMHFHRLIGMHKIAALILSAFIFLFGLWLGIVLGLDGTLWD